jgi:hypothetical protein
MSAARRLHPSEPAVGTPASHSCVVGCGSPVLYGRQGNGGFKSLLPMAHIYWLSLRAVLEPIFDWYFARANPERLTATRVAKRHV